MAEAAAGGKEKEKAARVQWAPQHVEILIAAVKAIRPIGANMWEKVADQVNLQFSVLKLDILRDRDQCKQKWSNLKKSLAAKPTGVGQLSPTLVRVREVAKEIEETIAGGGGSSGEEFSEDEFPDNDGVQENEGMAYVGAGAAAVGDLSGGERIAAGLPAVAPSPGPSAGGGNGGKGQNKVLQAQKHLAASPWRSAGSRGNIMSALGDATDAMNAIQRGGSGDENHRPPYLDIMMQAQLKEESLREERRLDREVAERERQYQREIDREARAQKMEDDKAERRRQDRKDNQQFMMMLMMMQGKKMPQMPQQDSD